MPQLQVVDLNPRPRIEKTPLEITLDSFSRRFTENRRDQQDTDALRDIYSQYQQDGNNLENALMSIQSRPGISPTARVNAANQLIQLQKYNNQRLAASEKRVMEEKKKASNQQILRDLEKRRGLEENSLAAYEDNPQMAAQITKPEKLTQASQPIKEDQLRRIAYVEEDPEFSKADVPKKAQMLRRAGVSKENIDSIINPEIEQDKQSEKDRKFHTEVSRPIVKEANERLKNANVNQGIRSQLRNDIASGETSGLFPFIVDKLGLETFRNPQSARFTNEVKNLFVESLNDIPGARPNMFIERFLSTAQPLIGRSTEANLSVLDVGDFIEDVRNEQAKRELQIAKQDREKYGYVREDVAERAREGMGDFVNRRQEKMALDIRSRKEEGMEDLDIINEIISDKIAPGSYVTPRMMRLLYIKNDNDLNKAVEEAKKHKLVIPEYLE